MFYTIITLSYTVPALYLFIRIWQLFIVKKHRLKFIFIYALLVSVYPLSMFIENRSIRIAAILETVSGYLLPFFLYMFLLLLLADILLFINLAFRLVSREKLKNAIYRKRLFIGMIISSVLIVLYGIINFNTIRVTRYKVETEKRNNTKEKLRIAFVSDFHLNEKTPKRFVNHYIKKIKELDPDIMLYGGDILEGRGEGLKMPTFEKMFREITPVYGSFGVLGNHDRLRNNDHNNFFKRAGIILLRDSVVFPGGCIAVAGRRDTRDVRMNIDELVASVPEGTPLIVIDHRPVDNDQISMTSTDIAFSGHTHHGQMFPINLITTNVYELSYGHMKKRNTHFIVSSGIRLWGPPVRTVAKSEIVVVDLIFK